jgi:hypothetical protein
VASSEAAEGLDRSVAAGAGLGNPVVAEASLTGAGVGLAGAALGSNMPAEQVVGLDGPSVAGAGTSGLGLAGVAYVIQLAAEAVGLGRPVAAGVSSGNFVVMVEASFMAVGEVGLPGAALDSNIEAEAVCSDRLVAGLGLAGVAYVIQLATEAVGLGRPVAVVGVGLGNCVAGAATASNSRLDQLNALNSSPKVGTIF